MEDTVVVASPLLQNTPHVHLLAVFDGHRGDAMAQYAQAHIAATVCRAASGGLGPADALTHAFVDMDRRFRDLEVWMMVVARGCTKNLDGSKSLTDEPSRACVWSSGYRVYHVTMYRTFDGKHGRLQHTATPARAHGQAQLP